jgi:oleandomycin transport system ATP-binding protein
MTHAIYAEGLVKRFGETTALAGVDLAVPQGTVLGMLGPNGAGKTTAVRILTTLLRPDAGHARVGGLDVVRQAHQVRRMVGLTGQYAAVDEDMTGTENLVLIGRLLGIPRRRAKERAAELLAQFGLADAGGRLVKTFSGGMRRRLDLAASLVSRPDVLFLDEPTTGLDPHHRNEMWDLVRDLAADGVTVLLTTQYLDEADQLADEIVVVDHGRVIASGTAEQLKVTVGGQTLAVRPVDRSRAPAVAAVVADLVGTQPATAARSGEVTAPVRDPQVLPAMVRRLDDAGIAIAELSLRLPSLDEVFLTLTGHRAEPDADTDEDAGTDEEGAAA